MRWYTAIGMKKDDADGRFCVWVDGEEKVLTEMETHFVGCAHLVFL